MKKTLFALFLALSLAGCATGGAISRFETTVSNAVGVIGNTKVNSKSAYVAINVFNAAERSATAYLRLPPCGVGAGTICRVSGAAAAIEQPFTAGIAARNDLRRFMKANPGTLADAGLYNTLTAATGTLQAVMDIYGVGSK